MVHGKNSRRNFIALAQYGSLSLFRRESLGMLLIGLNRDHKDIIRTWLTSRSAWPASHRPQTFLSELNVENRVKAAKLEHQPDMPCGARRTSFTLRFAASSLARSNIPRPEESIQPIELEKGFVLS